MKTNYLMKKVKREYMSTHKKGTQDILERLFKIAYQFESDLNKDIYDFTREELRKLFLLSCRPRKTLRNQQFCILIDI
ncbi:hypothetical protein HMSSN036_03660 [Paenibacillus macerans]|nr:hypothetical protein HMSSN036_03660 [Paenibacillus macerans]